MGTRKAWQIRDLAENGITYEPDHYDIPGRLEESVEVLLGAADLSAVHVHEEELHVLEVDVLEDDDGVLAGVAQEEVPEVGRAHRQDQLVGREVVVAAREGHVDELLLVAQVLSLQTVKTLITFLI